MNKLISLTEARNGKNKNRLLILKKIESGDSYNNSYNSFEEKFNLIKDNENVNALRASASENIEYEKSISKIMYKIFSMNNNILMIDFINYIYNDDLSLNAKVKYDKCNEVIALKNSGYNIKIFVQDEYRKFEYKIKFKTEDNKNLAVSISKKELTNNKKIISFNKKKKEYDDAIVNVKNIRECYDQCLIVLNSDIDVPDLYEYKSDFNESNIQCRINIIKGWKYDFKQLFERNMYLLFPLKVIDLRKRLLDINTDLVSKDLINDEILRFFNDMNKYLKRIKDLGLITGKEITEFNLIAIDLLKSLVNDKNNIFLNLNLKSYIQSMLKEDSSVKNKEIII